MSQIDDTPSSLERPESWTMNHSITLKPSLLGYFLYIPSRMVRKLITQFHSDTQILLSSNVRKTKSGRKTEKEREEFQTDDQLLMQQHIFLCQIFIFCSVFFFPRIWKHGLAIERLVKGFCFIMHWNYFRMAKERQTILSFFFFFFFFLVNRSMCNCVEENT